MNKNLSKKEIWCLVYGAAALATGGGGSVPRYDEFRKEVDSVLSRGYEARLIDPADLQDDELVFMDVGCGGGIRRKYQEKYMRSFPREVFPRNTWFKQIDMVHPLNSWSKKENPKAEEEHLQELEELVGDKPSAYLAFEIGPLDVGQLLGAAKRGLPLVDADCAGYRAVPELSLTGLNVINAPIVPYTIATSWGDVIIGTKVLSHQRWEDICRQIAVISGGDCSPAISLRGRTVKKGTAHNTFTLAMQVGKAILKAKEQGDDPIAAILKSTDGYKIFEGRIAGYTREGKGAFGWGCAWIDGTGDFEGKLFRLWYKNENHISWINEKPYITCPDPFTVIEKQTGLGLSNGRPEWWTLGKEVSVTAMKACDFWRSERGLRIYNPKHFGFDIDYIPIEERLG